MVRQSRNENVSSNDGGDMRFETGALEADGMHRDDKFHSPIDNDDPFWTETCWFTFAVPERGISGQLYPFFRPNQSVYAAGAFIWDQHGHELHTIRHGKNFWHLPMQDSMELTDIQLQNGISIKCIEPLKKFHVRYIDPDCGEAEVDLIFTAIAPPNHLLDSHYEQPGRYQGTLRLGDEIIPVDSYGMRDRSWNTRSQFGVDFHGTGAVASGYDYGTIDEDNAFHMISMAFEPEIAQCIHGYYMRDGSYAGLASGSRKVLARCKTTGAPTHVSIEAVDELGRELHAEGRCINKIGWHINPNLYSWNCLTKWEFQGESGYGEDHDNWTAKGARDYFRSFLTK